MSGIGFRKNIDSLETDVILDAIKNEVKGGMVVTEAINKAKNRPGYYATVTHVLTQLSRPEFQRYRENLENAISKFSRRKDNK